MSETASGDALNAYAALSVCDDKEFTINKADVTTVMPNVDDIAHASIDTSGSLANNSTAESLKNGMKPMAASGPNTLSVSMSVTSFAFAKGVESVVSTNEVCIGSINFNVLAEVVVVFVKKVKVLCYSLGFVKTASVCSDHCSSYG